MNRFQLPLSQDKWIAITVWIAILAALIVSTSGLGFSISIISGYLNIFQTGRYSPPEWMPVTVLIAALAVVFFFLRAWSMFFFFSKQLFIALGRSLVDGETDSVFYPFLTFKKAKGLAGSKNAELFAENASGSIISSIVWSVALSQLMALIEVAVFAFSSLFISR